MLGLGAESSRRCCWTDSAASPRGDEESPAGSQALRRSTSKSHLYARNDPIFGVLGLQTRHGDECSACKQAHSHSSQAHERGGGAQLLIFRLLSSHYVPSAVTASEGLSHTKGTGTVRGETTGREHVPSGSDEDASVAQHESCRQRVPDSSGASCEERLKIGCIY